MLLEIIGGLIVVAAVIIVLGVILVFNSLVTAKQRVNNAWAQIDVQLKKRADLVYNLVEIVKGYAKHEKGVFEDVARMRAGIMGASAQNEVISQSNALAAGLKSVFAVAEAYPDLKANQGFLDLQKQLVGLEDSIAKARMVYNDVVTIYNTRIMTVPQNLIAPLLGFKEIKQLEADSIARAPVKVKI
jgi:LemA protein